MKTRGELYVTYALCDRKGRFVFEVAPWIFGQKFLTEDEMWGWGVYYEMQGERGKEKG